MEALIWWRLVGEWGMVLGCYSVWSGGSASNIIAGAVGRFVGLGAL